MAKFTSNLRKGFNLRFSHMDSESGISGPLVYPPASLEDADSSNTLPSDLGQMRSKQRFSFRWNKHRTGPAVAQSVEKTNTRSIGRKMGLRGRRTKSSPAFRTSSSESKEIPTKFITLLRRSAPSWRSTREPRINSDILTHSTTSYESSYEACLPADPTPNHSPRDTKPVTGLQDLLDHEWRPFTKSSGGTMADVDSNPPKDSDEIDWRSIPPIIISSPTLPDDLCFPEETQTLRRPAHSEWKKSSLLVEDLEEPVDFSVVAMTLQSAARQLADDPSATQANVFRLSAPITAFVYILGIGVMLLKKEGIVFEPGIVAYAFVIPLGMLLVLALLRGGLWVMSKLGRSFCELDLEEIFARGIFVESEGGRLTDADFIVGNLIT